MTEDVKIVSESESQSETELKTKHKYLDKIKGIGMDFAETSQFIISTKRWLSVSTEPVTDCDVVIMFPIVTKEEFCQWVISSIRKQIPDLIVRPVEFKHTKTSGLYITASFQSLLKAADDVGLRKRLKMQYGGGYQEFILEQLDLFSQSDSAEDFFTSQERQALVQHMLYNWRTLTPNDKYENIEIMLHQPILPQLQVQNLVTDVFPLHLKSDLHNLQRTWIKTLQRRQPLDKIQEYFGVKIALYFAWLGHYTSSLIPASIFGILLWAISWDTWQDSIYLCLVVFNIIWSTLYLESWKRQSAVYTYKWGTLETQKSEMLDESRPLFKGTPAVSRITGKVVPYYPYWKRLIVRYCISVPVILLCLVITIATMFGLFRLQDFVTEAVKRGKVYSFVDMVPKMLIAVMISVYDEVYKRIAKYLNDLENIRVEESYRNHLILKMILFQVVNSFFSLFYVAFYMQDMVMLKESLVALLITRQLIGNVKEAALPTIMCKARQYMLGVQFDLDKRKRGSDSVVGLMTQAEHEKLLEPYEDPYEDYLEMFIQFGYLGVFAPAFPLAPFFCLINNVMEIRSDAFKLVHAHRRPFGTKVADIGVWQLAMEVMSCVSLTASIAVLGVSGVMHRMCPSFSDAQVVILLVVLEHVVFAVKLIIAYAIPDVPNSIEEEIAITEYRKRQALKAYQRADLENKRSRSRSNSNSYHGYHD